MATFEELDRLSSHDLHHRAISLAEHRLDLKFFWSLLEYIPEAEALKGDLGESETDIERPAAWLRDYADRGGRLDDALRPIYIDYLQRHG